MKLPELTREAFEVRMKQLVATHAGIPVSEVHDQTPVNDPEWLITMMVMHFGKSFVCEDLSRARTYGEAKSHITSCHMTPA